MAACNRFPSARIAASEITSYVKQGVQIVAPPLWALVALQGNRIVPSQYSLNAKGPPMRIGRTPELGFVQPNLARVGSLLPTEVRSIHTG